jgi:hypothetical protein
MKTRTTAEWTALLEKADIPVSNMNSIEDVVHDPHLAASGFFATENHPTEGKLLAPRTPTDWSESQPGAPRPAPRLGEHSAEVLGEAATLTGDCRTGAARRDVAGFLMDFSFTEQRRYPGQRHEAVRSIRRAVLAGAGPRRPFPEDFHRASRRRVGSVLRCPRSTEAGLGITEAALMMQAISQSGAGFSGASSVHMNIFGLNPWSCTGLRNRRNAASPLIRR